MPREARSIHRKATPEELDRMEQRWKDAEAEIPEFLARDERRARALQEPGFSGQLRRAVRGSGIHPHDLALAANIPLQDLADFMCGDAPLDSAAIDRLAEQLHFALVQPF